MNYLNKIKNHILFFYFRSFLIGALATFAIPPFSFLPIAFILCYGIYSISLIPSLKQAFFATWFLGFGWFFFGLYWLGSAFFVANTYHIILMLLSIIIPTKNRKFSLNRLLGSIFKQTLKDYEIIIVDQSDERINDYEKIKKIKYFYEPDIKSLTDAKNFGIKYSLNHLST